MHNDAVGVGPVPSSSAAVPQEALDELASAWSRLDRSRPLLESGVGPAVRVVGDWVVRALTVDELLPAAGQDECLARAVAGLRRAWTLVESGCPLEALLDASTGHEHEFWELYWRPLDRLPSGGWTDEAREGYRGHLAGRPVRTPASWITQHLLLAARRPEPSA